MEQVFQMSDSSKPRREEIKVIGIGGGGGNALNHIIRSGVDGVHFIAANTDIAALGLSEAKTRIILGKEGTRGHGAGADPEVGASAAKESLDEIKSAVTGADMVFLTAGMGGGTGTGATPIIAEVSKSIGALVVAVVTTPFFFEQNQRNEQARKGIAVLKEKVDALLVVENDKLLAIADKNLSLIDSFKLADEVLRQAVQGVTDLILKPGLINVDFADVKTVMMKAGSAIMGIGEGQGEKRAQEAAEAALRSPLMSTPMKGAKGILFNVTGGEDVKILEIQQAAEIIRNVSDDDALVIWGHTIDAALQDKIRITVIATGFTTEKEKKNAGLRTNHRGRSGGVILEEADILTPQDEDLFTVSGVPKTPYDVPSIIRRSQKAAK
jgi:cell division protein FtsZ